jgi:hypothetical protein
LGECAEHATDRRRCAGAAATTSTAGIAERERHRLRGARDHADHADDSDDATFGAAPPPT